MSEPYVIRDTIGAIATLTMNRPKALNALSNGMLDALQAEFDAIAGDRNLRAVILRGSGRAFCAGHDLKEMTAARQAEDGGKQAFADLFAKCTAMMLSIRDLPQPVIAQVHGLAAAAGCQLVASCDMAVAEDQTNFGVNGVNIGLFCSTPMVALSRNIPRKQALEMLTTGRFMPASEAVIHGLINRAVGAEMLDSETLAMAEKVAEKLGAVVKIGKQAFYRQLEMPIEEAYAYTSGVIVENMMFRDTAEGIAAFIEKRDPDWDQG